MHEDSLERLDAYLDVVDARVRTSRRASEVFFNKRAGRIETGNVDEYTSTP